uniref:Uncharacterized protein n=1 Tax=Alexandrium monilatum TaxID=311494 RepID=A0A6T1BD68_9DINO
MTDSPPSSANSQPVPADPVEEPSPAREAKLENPAWEADARQPGVAAASSVAGPPESEASRGRSVTNRSPPPANQPGSKGNEEAPAKRRRKSDLLPEAPQTPPRGVSREEQRVEREIAKGLSLVHSGKASAAAGRLEDACSGYVLGLQRLLALDKQHPKIVAIAGRLARYVDEAERLQRELDSGAQGSCGSRQEAPTDPSAGRTRRPEAERSGGDAPPAAPTVRPGHSRSRSRSRQCLGDLPRPQALPLRPRPGWSRSRSRRRGSGGPDGGSRRDAGGLASGPGRPSRRASGAMGVPLPAPVPQPRHREKPVFCRERSPPGRARGADSRSRGAQDRRRGRRGNRGDSRHRVVHIIRGGGSVQLMPRGAVRR